MSRKRRDRGSRPRSEHRGEESPRPQREDPDAREAQAETEKPAAEEGREVYLMGSLTESARVPGDFGRDIGDETDLWI